MDDDGWNVLHHAADRSHEQVVVELLAAGIN